MPFSPGEGSLQYKNPIMSSEMLEIVASLETEKLVEKRKETGCFSLQVDKSVDKHNVNSLLITARYMDSDYSLKVTFLGEAHSDLHGAEGILKALIDMFEVLSLSETLLKRLVGLTTDGEAGNTGSKRGLWKTT